MIAARPSPSTTSLPSRSPTWRPRVTARSGAQVADETTPAHRSARPGALRAGGAGPARPSLYRLALVPGGRLRVRLHQDPCPAWRPLHGGHPRRSHLPVGEFDVGGADRPTRRLLGAGGSTRAAGAGRHRAPHQAIPAGGAGVDLVDVGNASQRLLGGPASLVPRRSLRSGGPA